MPKCFQLIGVPYSGKSTWIKTQTVIDNPVVIGTDIFLQEFLTENGRNWSKIYDDYMPLALDKLSHMLTGINRLEANAPDLIWEQTSCTKLARAKKFRALPYYEHIAVVFKTPDAEELNRRMSARKNKTVPIAVIHDMIKNWEEPTLEEGFSEILYVNTN
jgi:predicted kinase